MGELRRWAYEKTYPQRSPPENNQTNFPEGEVYGTPGSHDNGLVGDRAPELGLEEGGGGAGSPKLLSELGEVETPRLLDEPEDSQDGGDHHVHRGDHGQVKNEPKHVNLLHVALYHKNHLKVKRKNPLLIKGF